MSNNKRVQLWSFLFVVLISIGGMKSFRLLSSENETSSEEPTILINVTWVDIETEVGVSVDLEVGRHCFCTKELAPVCDVSGKEYSNECVLNCVSKLIPGVVLGCRHRCPC